VTAIVVGPPADAVGTVGVIAVREPGVRSHLHCTRKEGDARWLVRLVLLTVKGLVVSFYRCLK
jgi:hypothetical protein